MQLGLKKIAGGLAFLMFLSFGTSAFATEDVSESSEELLVSDLFGDEMVVEGNVITEEFIDEEGKQNRMVIELEEDRNVVSLFVEGELEQQSIGDKENNVVTGFSNYGENQFEKDIKDLIATDIVMPSMSNSDVMVNPMAVGYYSQVSSRASVPNAMCKKKVTAYLYQKSTTTNTSKINISFSRGEVLTAIVATIITAVVLKSKPSIGLLKEMFTSVGVGVVTGALASGFSGNYQVKKDIKDYYATISGTKYFTNKITREHLTLYNKYTGKAETRFLGQHVSAYGKPTSYQVMLSQAIVNWSNATKCR